MYSYMVVGQTATRYTKNSSLRLQWS